jgi:hypothetical protein
VVDHFIAPHDPTDPLTSKGGLDPTTYRAEVKARLDVNLKD